MLCWSRIYIIYWRYPCLKEQASRSVFPAIARINFDWTLKERYQSRRCIREEVKSGSWRKSRAHVRVKVTQEWPTGLLCKRSLNYLRAANWRMSLKKGQTLVRGQRENLERKFNSIIIVINFKYMFKVKEWCVLYFNLCE